MSRCAQRIDEIGGLRIDITEKDRLDDASDYWNITHDGIVMNGAVPKPAAWWPTGLSQDATTDWAVQDGHSYGQAMLVSNSLGYRLILHTACQKASGHVTPAHDTCFAESPGHEELCTPVNSPAAPSSAPLKEAIPLRPKLWSWHFMPLQYQIRRVNKWMPWGVGKMR